MKVILSALVGMIFLTACGNNASTENVATDTAIAKADNTAVAPKVDTVPAPASIESYSGILPCADCQGIETSIALNSDGTFNQHMLYKGRKSKGAGSNEFSTAGKWMLHGMDTVHLTDVKNQPSMYIRTDSSLIQLDLSGKRITGKQAAKYELKKNAIK
jgi:uncharacterized lipoprotein NlpE involved in copper resistance